MSTYKPRSGTFRKVKYPLKIYKTKEIPKKDVSNVLEMVAKIKGDETLDCPQYQLEECKGVFSKLSKKRSLKLERLKLLAEKASETIQPKAPQVLPEAQFSLIPDEEYLYKRCFKNDDALPQFPINSSSGINLSSDSEDSEQYSGYDMDTEDEDWLEANKESNITRSRLEYIFTNRKLNKRNTHAPKNAIGALPKALHNDFHVLFPYWKEKRLQNKLLSSFPQYHRTAGAMKKDTRAGYIPSDPYVIFTCIPCKSLPRKHPSPLLNLPQKIDKQKELLELRERLTMVGSWASEAIGSGINTRNEIVNNYSSFMQNQQAIAGKENFKVKLKEGHSNEIAKSVKYASVPAKVSKGLTKQRKEMNQDRKKGDATHQATERVPGNVKRNKLKSKLLPSKKPTKLSTLNRECKGKRKDKNKKACRHARIKVAMP